MEWNLYNVPLTCDLTPTCPSIHQPLLSNSVLMPSQHFKLIICSDKPKCSQSSLMVNSLRSAFLPFKSLKMWNLTLFTSLQLHWKVKYLGICGVIPSCRSWLWDSENILDSPIFYFLVSFLRISTDLKQHFPKISSSCHRVIFWFAVESSECESNSNLMKVGNATGQEEIPRHKNVIILVWHHLMTWRSSCDFL